MISDLPTWNFGASTTMTVGGITPTSTARSLIRFTPRQDLIDATSVTVVSATLNLHVGSVEDSTHTISIYRCLQDWEEGAGGAGVVSNWNEYGTGANWNTAGCASASDSGVDDSTAYDRYATAEDVIVIDAADVNSYVSLDVTDLVQKWVNGTNKEYGVLIQSDREGVNNQAQFDTSDSGVDGWRPYLEITYIP